MQKKCVVLCGGGTGGHIYPNLALAPMLEPFRRVCYIGNENGMEQRLCSEQKIEFFPIHAPKFKRSLTFENTKLPFAMIKCVRETKEILKQLSPAVIFSKGGYVSLPVCLAGISLGIPVLCHESDLTVGLANKIAWKRGGTLLTSFKETKQGKKRVLHMGAPLRRELFENIDKVKGIKQNVNNIKQKNISEQNLLIIGGSQGAKIINENVLSSLPKLSKQFKITHITGVGKTIPTSEIKRQFSYMNENDIAKMLDNYNQIEYSTDMGSLYQNTDIALSRGGANALFELLEFEIPTLVIPLEKGSRGDQVENAEYFTKEKLCHKLSENHMFGLFESVVALSNSSSQIKENIKNAKNEIIFNGRDNIAKLILSH